VALDVDAVQTALLAVTVFTFVAGLVAACGRYRDARLLTLLADDQRRLERTAERVREVAEAADRVLRRERPRETFRLAQLRLVEALATVPAELPETRRLLVLEPEAAHRVAAQARAALAEISDRALEAEIDRDLYTLGFAWARRRRREVDARIEARAAPQVALPASERRAA
jgi:ABC-type transporter Mla subunit MlaD